MKAVGELPLLLLGRAELGVPALTMAELNGLENERLQIIQLLNGEDIATEETAQAMPEAAVSARQCSVLQRTSVICARPRCCSAPLRAALLVRPLTRVPLPFRPVQRPQKIAIHGGAASSANFICTLLSQAKCRVQSSGA